MGRQLKLKTAHQAGPEPWDADLALARALAQRDEFLERYPQYKGMQYQIDQLLDKAGSAENRMTVLALLMEGKLVELHNQLKTLNHILLKAAG